MTIKRIMIIILHLALVGVTSGLWLLVLVPYLLWRKQKENKTSSKASVEDSRIPKAKYSDQKFAQDGGQGEIFSYASLKDGQVLDAPFAVIDLETTGLEKTHHRIVEIAIRRISRDGALIDEFSTLINPQAMDVGPTFIHHIRPEDVIGAPTFSEISSLVVSRLSGCIAVAHHAAFEDGFLGSEFKKAGISVPPIPCIDTLWLARNVIDLPNYKLGTVAGAFGIEEIDAHTALGDVRILSQLLPRLLEKSRTLRFKQPLSMFESAGSVERVKTRVSNLRKGQEGWMTNIVRKLPETGSELSTEVAIAYSEILTRVLSDGKITGEEAKELAKFAGASGLGSRQLQELHRDYLVAIEKVALSDGSLSEAELNDLAAIKLQLGI